MTNTMIPELNCATYIIICYSTYLRLRYILLLLYYTTLLVSLTIKYALLL
jgi:hypothetical protein